MKVYQNIPSYQKSTIDFTVVVQPNSTGFSICGGSWADSTALTGFSTGFSVSGENGYLFDQSGNFFGGYKINVPFNLSFHFKSGAKYSYFHDDQLIANNFNYSTIDTIEFGKDNSTLNFTVKGVDLSNALSEISYEGSPIEYEGELILFS